MKGGVVVRRVLTTALTVLAFWNSWTHTVQWFADHGQGDAARWLALIPEAGLILGLLFLAGGNLTAAQRVLVGLVGVGSVGITISANLAGASPGLAGKVAALVAPVFAILGFALEITGDRTRDTGPVPKAGPVVVSESTPDRRTGADQKSGPADRTSRGPVVVVHPDQRTGPVRTKPVSRGRTTRPRSTPDRRTDAELIARIGQLVATGELPADPSATRIRAALACNKTRAGQLKKDFAAQARVSDQQAG